VPDVRQLLPVPLAEVDPMAAHAATLGEAPQAAGRPHVTCNMIASIDGATAIEGRSGELGGPADKLVFRAIRATADVILVAAGTVRAEGYGPPRTSPEVQAARAERGQHPHPRIAVVSGSLSLDPTSPLFVEASEPPLVLTSDDADDAAADALRPVAEVVRLGPGPVRPEAMLARLQADGTGRVVCEGGPTLNGQLVAAGLVDSFNLSLSPTLVGGDSLRVAVGDVATTLPLALAHLWHDEDEDLLFARYVRR
jgi:riboflavin-specific deaminase-like protein